MPSSFLKGAALLALVAISSAGAAQAAGRVGWLWANDANATSAYTPDSAYSYNSAGGSITVTPLGTGAYEVSFGGLHTKTGADNVLVTANQTSGYCTAGTWSHKGATLNANVYCFNASGAPANAQFDLLYQERTGIFGTDTKGLAFLYANSPTAASYTPKSDFQYNSTGGTNTITRLSPGSYAVDIPGLAPNPVDIPGLTPHPADVQVSAVTTTGASGARCRFYYWGSDGSSGTDIYVLCFNSAGAFADELFDVALAVDEPFGLAKASNSPGAWALAHLPWVKRPYITEDGTRYNDFGTNKITSQKEATGTYELNIPGTLSYASSTVLVTASGDGATSTYCNSSGWYPIDVTCYAQGGTPIDGTFVVTFQTSR